MKLLPLLLALAGARLVCGSPPHNTAQEQHHKQELFQRIFGEKTVAFDPAAVVKLKTMKPGERLKLDTDGDGKIDTVYFIDNDPKNQAEFRPIIVKAIDQDGDMDRDGDADLDSDLYLADWHGDGTVDAVVEYRDTDHDGIFDTWTVDVDGDGVPDRTVHIPHPRAQPVSLHYKSPASRCQHYGQQSSQDRDPN